VSAVLHLLPTQGDDARTKTRTPDRRYLAAVLAEWASLTNDVLAHDHPETAALCLGLLADTLSKVAAADHRQDQGNCITPQALKPSRIERK
jgi:hypothetical protein